MIKHEALSKALERIAASNGGRLTPDAVVEEARDRKSPLHDQFTWDDTQAAIQWRLEQARTLIRSVRIDIHTETRVVNTVRYVRDPQAGREQGYADVVVLRTDTDLARDALRRELASAKALFERTQSLADVFGMKSEVVDLQERVAQLDVRLEEAVAA